MLEIQERILPVDRDRVPKQAHDTEVIPTSGGGACAEAEPEGATAWVGVVRASDHQLGRDVAVLHHGDRVASRTVHARHLEPQLGARVTQSQKKTMNRLGAQVSRHEAHQGFDLDPFSIFVESLHAAGEAVGERAGALEEVFEGIEMRTLRSFRHRPGEREGALGIPELGEAVEVHQRVAPAEPRGALGGACARGISPREHLEPPANTIEQATLGLVGLRADRRGQSGDSSADLGRQLGLRFGAQSLDPRQRIPRPALARLGETFLELVDGIHRRMVRWFAGWCLAVYVAERSVRDQIASVARSA